MLVWAISPDGDKKDHQNGEDHLHVGQGMHPKHTHNDQLDYLKPCEVMDLPLRHTSDVVGRRI